MSDEQKELTVRAGETDVLVDLESGPVRLPLTSLPEPHIDWIEQGRRSMYKRLLTRKAPVGFFSAHLPVMVTHSGDKVFPFNCTNKGIGFIPKQEHLAELTELFQATLDNTRGRPWRKSAEERIEAISRFYFDRERIDYRAMSGLEIFTTKTFQNLKRTPLAGLHFTGCAPNYMSFQVNCAVEVIGPEDPRHTFVLLARTLFEYDDFHIVQPQYPFAYICWISEVVDKTPQQAEAGADAVREMSTRGGMGWSPEALQAVERVPGMIRQFVREQIEDYVRERDADEVTLELVQEAREKLEEGVESRPAAESPPATGKYGKIFVAIDGSELSNEATRLAIRIGRETRAELFGGHVYAAKLHDQRFRAMEAGLPEKFQEENELEKQRETHDSLITQGLELITDSYLEGMSALCREENLPFTGISLEGRNWQALVQNIEAHDYDLVTLGALGVGRVSRSLLGTVAERILRRVRRDILICKRGEAENRSNDIVVCLDGSTRSWGALMRGIELAKTLGKELIAVSAFDPYFHYTMFNCLNGVLTDRARELFKFEEQEKLHEDIIDSGLAKIYQSHLNVADRIAQDEGIALKTQLLDGKAYEKILEFVHESPPWLLVMGRIGMHSDETMDIGGNTENLCRLAPCNLLIVDAQFEPRGEYRAEETITWTKEAEARMSAVPPMAQGVAMQAVQNYCLAEGHTIVTGSVLSAAIKEILPPEALEKMGIVFDDEAGAPADDDQTDLSFRCLACGHVHHGSRPQSCPICGREGGEFKLVASEKVVDGVAANVLGNRELTWEKSCLEALEKVADPILRQQIKTQLEKQALTRRLSTITLEMFRECAGPQPAPGSADPGWTDAAVERLERVPEGFMRRAAQETVEGYARENHLAEITLEVAELGLSRAREKMAASIGGEKRDSPPRSDVDDLTAQPAIEGSFECSMCGYVADGHQPEHCPSCKGDQFEELTAEEREAASETAPMILEWDRDARERIERIPAGFMRTMTRCRIEKWARKHGYDGVSLEVVEEKYRSWEGGPRELQCELTWSADARARVEKIPEFIKPRVMKEIERYAAASGKGEVDSEHIDEILETWADSKTFHQPA